MPIDLTVVIPARNDTENLRVLLPNLRNALQSLAISSEVLVVAEGSRNGAGEVARMFGARLIVQAVAGYGGALKTGFQQAQGVYILTMGADLSHEPNFVSKLWANRHQAEMVIASRYVRGGVAYMPLTRTLLSRVLNRLFTKGLSLDLCDISSGFRLYRSSLIKNLVLTGSDVDLLPEIIVRAYGAGWRIVEVPFTYFPRLKGGGQARMVRAGANLAKTFVRMWSLRRSIESADYDERAFYTPVLPQRFWYRKRHEIIMAFARSRGRTLDVGCGSSVILQNLNQAVGLDIRHAKMRYMRRYGVPVVTGSIYALPFPDRSMDCVICSEVIEHIPPDPKIFTELDRVLQPGGLLILGTPDYATWLWPRLERLWRVVTPGGYMDEHISHYTRASLEGLLTAMKYELLDFRYVFRSELIIAARKRQERDSYDPTRVVPWLPTPISR
jgi:dolichol-phosphate mannosyltransferase